MAHILLRANSSSSDVTIFQVGTGGVLSGGTSYALPSGSSAPESVAFSPNGSYLTSANAGSSDVTIYQVGTGGVLSGGYRMDYQAVLVEPDRVAFYPMA